jgi:hypothetical protein
MTDVSISGDFNRPATVLWAAIGDFCGIGRWLPGIQQVQAEDGGKRRRIILPDGGVVLEQEIERDEAAMSLTYTVITAPMPFSNYRSTMCIEPRGDGCSLRWSATFSPIGSEDKVARLVGSLYRAGIKGLQALVDPTARESV